MPSTNETIGSGEADVFATGVLGSAGGVGEDVDSVITSYDGMITGDCLVYE
ncbi:MAG TPA: hypothetical protein VFT59_05580 [Candidatus Saccharimonadales bacterium]|nr:hypothetical protein [Candidatus Saccharimonadales bacterium]